MMDHRRYLEAALQEAVLAQYEGEDPIGCVIVDEQGGVIAQAHNHINQYGDPTAHAELRAIRMVIARMRGEAARGWTLYSTLEPCPLCLGAIVMCHIGTIVWAANDRRKETHKLLSANAYMQTRRLVTVATPYADLEAKCSTLHDEYWMARGRPEVVRAIEEGEAATSG
jgi:tRNA(adenine34) deaminase